MIKKSTRKVLLYCKIIIFFTCFGALSAQTGPNDDFDSDGIVNSIDIDDDNDGILDEVECPPPAVFYNFVWQGTGGVNTANIQPGNRLISPNVFQVNGQSYDAYFELISKNSGTGGSASGITIYLNGGTVNMDGAVPNLQNYIVYDIFFVKSGDPVTNIVTFNELNFKINDLDNGAIGGPAPNYTDVGAFITTPYTQFTFGSKLQLIAPYGSVNNVYGLTATLQGATNEDATGRDPANVISAKFVQQQRYRLLHGLSGTNTIPVNTRGIVIGVQVLDKYCNTDGDSLPNHLDLDSDGDGCPDAVEAGTAAQAGAGNTSSGTLINTGGSQTGVLNAVVGNGIPSQYGANGFYNGIETSAESGVYAGSYAYQLATNAAYNLCTDTDNDGITDFFDLDDDNDGVPDATESPSCFYTAIEAGTIAVVSTPLANDDGVNVDLPFMHDGVTASIAASNNVITANQPVNGAVIYTIDYPTAIRLTSISHYGTTFGTSATAKIQGSNDKITWDELMTAATAATANPKIFTINNNTANSYRYYRIVKVAGTTTPAITSYEISAVQNTAGYNPSAHPKANCADADIDGDGIPPHRDLDTDGDGCSDAYEAGATTNTAAGYQFPYVDSNSDGLVDAVDPDGNGIVNYNSTYNLYALASYFKLCADTDGDGVMDMVDIDDDNDGVPDKTECPALLANMAANGGFSGTADSLPNWYMGLTSTALPVTEPFTPSVIPISNNGIVYNYGIGGGNQVNSPLTGGLFDIYENGNPATGLQYVLQEHDPQRPVVNKLANPLIAGIPYNFSFDLGNRGSGSGNRYIVLLYNADTQMPEKMILSGVLNTLPAYNSSPSYVNFTGSFIPNSSANYYLLFYPSISGGINDDFVIDRVAVAAASTSVCDTDGDGIPDFLDLDSDGDGCPDAVEAGVSANPGAAAAMSTSGGAIYTGGIPSGTANAYVGNGTPSQYGSNGFFNDIETGENGIYNGTLTYSQYALANNLNLCADTDGDGINDITDIDDDNDGVLDAVESPDCFYTAAEANVISRITSQFVSPDDDQSDRDIQILHDGSTALVFNFNAYAAGSNPTGSNLFTIEYPTAVKLATLSVSQRISATANANAVIVGSNDGVTWSSALSPSTLITATPVNFTVTTTTAYRYYRIQTGSVPGALALANTIGEITSTIVTADYVPSAHPKPNCATDFDGDGIFNHLDSDSDNDGCSDADESGTITYASNNGGVYSSGTLDNPSSTLSSTATVGSNSPADYGANGFYNIFETSENGIYLGSYIYSNAINATITACSLACYRPAVTSGTALDTQQGITSLRRAGVVQDNWPMVRKGAWTALESKTKGFVVNRLTAAQIAAIPASDLVEGMMVYNIDSDCLYINTDQTPTGWKCFNTQTCP